MRIKFASVKLLEKSREKRGFDFGKKLFFVVPSWLATVDGTLLRRLGSKGVCNW
jgi:hypothetical protein